MNIVFVAGPSRSGTTAFTRYLNQHPEIMIGIERFKWIPREEITPEIFTLDRIMAFEEEYEKRGTESRRNVHKSFVDQKDPEKLKWMGDKFPQYTRSLGLLSENNPGASFIVTYRPVEEVAESYEARSNNPDDAWLGGKDGFLIGIRDWNRDLRRTREFIESGVTPNVLIIGYHDFFYSNEKCIPLISRFLDLEFGESVRESWRETSEKFESGRRDKEPLTEEKQALIERNADHEAEAWILDYINRQWEELELFPDEVARTLTRERRKMAARLAEERSRARLQSAGETPSQLEELRGELESARGKAESCQKENQRLRRRLRRLENQTQSLQSSRVWKALTVLQSIWEKAINGAKRLKTAFNSLRKS